MCPLNLSPVTLVADLLAASPLMPAMFVALRVDCAGCSMSRFCTLADLCRHYGLEFETLAAELKKAKPELYEPKGKIPCKQPIF